MKGYEARNALDTAIADLTAKRNYYANHAWDDFSDPDVTTLNNGTSIVSDDGTVVYIPDTAGGGGAVKSLTKSIERYAVVGGISGSPCRCCGGTGRE